MSKDYDEWTKFEDEWYSAISLNTPDSAANTDQQQAPLEARRRCICIQGKPVLHTHLHPCTATNIHQYGKLKDSRQILKDVTGEDFNPQYYVDYLIEKYSKVYGV